MTPDDIRDQVRTLVSRLLGADLTPAQDELPLAGIDPDKYDSLGVLDCVAGVEQELGISVDLVDDDLRVTFRSVASIAALAGRKLADARALEWQL
ncbi:acyl carrier protein [Nonomuraea sp. NN258]|uniref:acyl carrier protein n=1 Tax=Nonomuraea antri TaxID=2730852 RepID=UPI00156949AE|nr:acyl carrier protein [Nonomuraea antri]NRQ37774.1 acyl carrier protein [Nonomuraea antri]